MSTGSGLIRKAHFLGAKIRSLRKCSHMTLEDLSLRCMQVDRRTAPSVSYLSMIENGKRVPSAVLLQLLATVFQREVEWFLDESPQPEAEPGSSSAFGVKGMPLEPGVLFSKELLGMAIPELLSQTGTSGRQFAHLLIRSYQEKHQNRFPDLERAADEVGSRQFPLRVDELLALYGKHDLQIRWFERRSFTTTDDAGVEIKTMVRSFFEAPGTVYVNRRLQQDPARLRYDLATQLAHKVLHGGDGLRSSSVTGGQVSGPAPAQTDPRQIDSRDILLAWRDFECSFFAGALLCPARPFRQFLIRTAHSITAGKSIELTPSVVMRRMTAVSPYRHWHYFDAYPPGNLRAVYRGNGIPLPWGNMRLVSDPCRQWAVFRMLDTQVKRRLSQISILQTQSESRLYSCESLRTRNAAGNAHVLCAGIDLSPALREQGMDADGIVDAIGTACRRGGGSAEIPTVAREDIARIGKILNIGWLKEGLQSPASIICPRSTACPRSPPCAENATRRPRPWLDEVREQIIAAAGA